MVPRGNQENVTIMTLTTMGEWVRVGMAKAVQEKDLSTEREVGQVLRAGLEVKQEV